MNAETESELREKVLHLVKLKKRGTQIVALSLHFGLFAGSPEMLQMAKEWLADCSRANRKPRKRK